MLAQPATSAGSCVASGSPCQDSVDCCGVCAYIGADTMQCLDCTPVDEECIPMGNRCCDGGNKRAGAALSSPAHECMPFYERNGDVTKHTCQAVAHTDVQNASAPASASEVGTGWRQWTLKCDDTELSGVYHDLKDGNNKIIGMTSRWEMSIIPPAPDSEYYVEGVGQDWAVMPADVAGINNRTCTIGSIDFDVPNKPNPPPENVTAFFKTMALMDIPWVAQCSPSTVGSEACGQCGAGPVRFLEGPQLVLAFGRGLFDVGNIWVKIADQPPATKPAAAVAPP
jgi:hypothetical protein